MKRSSFFKKIKINLLHVFTYVIFLFSLITGLIFCDPKNDKEICETLESARCQRAVECSHKEDLQECLDYYLEDCRHRIISENFDNPSDQEVEECVNVISALDCDIISDWDWDELNSEQKHQCHFLNPDDDEDEEEDAGNDSNNNDETSDVDNSD